MLWTLLMATGAAAFPRLALEDAMLQARQTSGNQDGEPFKCTPVPPAFDAKSQYVSNSGAYAFVAPGPLDSRGPCPGLNAAANHGYLPHNGLATVAEFVSGTYAVFGMAADLAGFLGIYGAIFDGNLEAYSIGGPNAQLPNINGLLGTPTGLSGSHNRYENDASPIRGDLYKYGNDYLSQVELFEQFYAYQDGVADEAANFGLDVITAFRIARYKDSVATNPYFFNGPFSGAIASPAAYSFIYRFMANKSAEYPEGRLDRETLKLFYSMTGEPGSFVYKPGYERIPDNWYKRNALDSYSIPYFFCDAFNQYLAYPDFLSVGGNLGKVDTFFGLEPGNLSNGVYNAKDFTNPTTFGCFLLSFGQAAPDFFQGIYNNVTPAYNALADAVHKAIAPFECPDVIDLEYAQFGQFPGYSRSYDGYSSPT